MREWDHLCPGDLLRWTNDRGGMEYVFIVAVVERERRHPYDEGQRILCFGRTIGLKWMDEFELLDSEMLNHSESYPVASVSRGSHLRTDR